MVTQVVRKIIDNYVGEPPGVKANLVRMLMHGKLSGTGKLLILPVDQGFEHGPLKSFSVNPASYDPDYHFSIAIEGGMNAYAAPIGMLQSGADKYAGQIPLILKLNSSTSLRSSNLPPNQAVISNVRDALSLGCVAVGFTLYPGSDCYFDMLEELRKIISEARSVGLVVVVWAYARGGSLTSKEETALDIICYGAHMACLVGAHIVKVKLPSAHLSGLGVKIDTDISFLQSRVEMVKQSCLGGSRLVVFSGGASKSCDDLYKEVEAIKAGGANGSIIGRNIFQRPRQEALKILEKIVGIYQ